MNKVLTLINKKEYQSIIDNDTLYIHQDFISDQGLIKVNSEYVNFVPKYHLNKYSPLGDYLNFSALNVLAWRIVTADDNGIPINNYNDELHYYPITIAHYGLQLYGQLIKPYRCYMGHNFDHKISYDLDSDIIYLNGPLSTGYEIKIIKNFFINNITIHGKGQFRVHFEFKNGEKVIVYDGKTQGHGDIKYISINDFVTTPNDIEISSIKLRGNVSIKLDKHNIACDKEVIKVAEWLVANQDDDGCWRANFEHIFYKGRTAKMEAGWSSALAQGLAISFLTRMYHFTGDIRYLESSTKGVLPFGKLSSEGGVLTYWEGVYPFYEEYPTEPASFVLNGFMFSLLGLYDLSSAGSEEASSLLEKGLITLKKMLPLYDLGNKSAYDLTHYTAHSYPNIARWGYHATHINQLFAIYTITDDTYYLDTLKRWRLYLDVGHSCKTN